MVVKVQRLDVPGGEKAVLGNRAQDRKIAGTERRQEKLPTVAPDPSRRRRVTPSGGHAIPAP